MRVDLVGDAMIPKRIITTWICDPANDPYDDAHRDLFARCLRSWLKFMPDYEITILTRPSILDATWLDPWVLEQMNRGQYIGASNWARLKWLQQHGGIYLDMDVEAVKRFDALRETDEIVVGHMRVPKTWVNTAVLMGPAGHPIWQALIDRCKAADPHDAQFGNTSGPIAFTDVLRARGWSGLDAAKTIAGVRVVPSPVFYPYAWTERYTPACVKPETVAIHHWGESWKRVSGLVPERAKRGIEQRLA